ncbi:MAG: hypothetical protein IJK62_14485 [Bacteroidales bacterium]|nr:hypothetical protein [Bacteroidales bacterium]
MKKLLLFIVLSVVITFLPCDGKSFVNETNASSDCCYAFEECCDDAYCEDDYVGNTVYICTGQYAKAYHRNRNCSGLGNCRAEIKQVSLEDAKRKGRTPCGKCCR